MTFSIDPNELKFAKLSYLVTGAKYINKIAEALGEKPLSEDEVVQVVNRADELVPDTAITTMDDPTLKSRVFESLSIAAKEILEDKEKPRVQPEDMLVEPLGAGDIVSEVAKNPHANTGGIIMPAEVKTIETNLIATKTGEGEKDMDKISTLIGLVLKLANQVEALEEKIKEYQDAVQPKADEPIKTEDVTQVNEEELIKKLIKEDDIYEPKEGEDVDELQASPEKNENSSASKVSEGKEAKVNKDKIAAIFEKYNARKNKK